MCSLCFLADLIVLHLMVERTISASSDCCCCWAICVLVYYLSDELIIWTHVCLMLVV